MTGAPVRVPLEELIPADLLKSEVRTWAARIGVRVREIHIRPMTRKWASCSTTGRLTFDAALLREPAELRTEVIVHELLHLKVGNHGKLFRSLLRAYLGRNATVLSMSRHTASEAHGLRRRADESMTRPSPDHV